MIAHSGVNYGYRTRRKRTVVIRTVTYYSIGQDVDNLFTSPGTRYPFHHFDAYWMHTVKRYTDQREKSNPTDQSISASFYWPSQ